MVHSPVKDKYLIRFKQGFYNINRERGKEKDTSG